MNPSELDLFALPSVTLEQRSLLPTTPCIYFAIDGQGVVQYIGQSVNPKRRWLNHHKGIEVGGMPGARIAYLSVDAPELLSEIEQALIKWFNPPLNGNEGRPSGEEVYGEPKKKRTLSVTESGWQGVIQAARASGCSSVSEFLERLGRGQVAT